MSFAESKSHSLEPWQAELVRIFENRGEIFPGMPRRNIRWEFHWTMQLMWMRTQWMNGETTVYFSPNFCERLTAKLIFDEFIFIDDHDIEKLNDTLTN